MPEVLRFVPLMVIWLIIAREAWKLLGEPKDAPLRKRRLRVIGWLSFTQLLLAIQMVFFWEGHPWQ